MKIREVEKKFGIISEKDFKIINIGLITSSIKNTTSFATSELYLREASDNPNIHSIIITDELLHLVKDKIAIVSKDPLKTFYELYHFWLDNEKEETDINKNQNISKSARIHSSAIISGKNVFIDDDVLIEERVVIKEGVSIGKNTIIRAGTIIGCEGFHVVDLNGKYVVFRHNGYLKIGNNVEIQSLCSIDRGIFGETTIIGDEVVIGNLTQISHNAQIGERTVILPHVTVSGSARIGSHVYIAPGVAVSNVKIGDNSRVSIGSVVGSNVRDNETVTGNFAVKHELFLNQQLFMRRNCR